jgi:hypothetical protein
MTDLEPLNGYMLKVSNAGTLTYPAGEPLLTGGGSGKREAVRQKTEDAIMKTVRPEAFEYSGQITASVYLDGENFAGEDYCLYSVVGGQVRGVSRGMRFDPTGNWVHNHLTYSNLSDGDTVRLRLRVADCGLQGGIWYEFEEYVVFKADMVVSNALHPFILKTSRLLDPSALRPEPSLDVWPNPASTRASIRYAIISDQPVVIQVMDYSGRLVDELQQGKRVKGEYTMDWDTRQMKPGVYFLRLKDVPGIFKQIVITR